MECATVDAVQSTSSGDCLRLRSASASMPPTITAVRQSCLTHSYSAVARAMMSAKVDIASCSYFTRQRESRRMPMDRDETSAGVLGRREEDKTATVEAGAREGGERETQTDHRHCAACLLKRTRNKYSSCDSRKQQRERELALCHRFLAPPLLPHFLPSFFFKYSCR